MLESTQNITLPHGAALVKQWAFDDITIRHSQWQFTDYGAILRNDDQDAVHLHFNLKGKMVLEDSSFGKHIALGSHHHNMFYANGFEGVVKNEELTAETFVIQFTREAFLRLAEGAAMHLKGFINKVKKGEPAALSEEELYIDLPLNEAIRQIIRCHYPDGLRKIFLLSKCMEIIVLQAESFIRSQNTPIKYCKTEYDKERILFARDYLIQHVEIPPSLPELAHIAGINEFKLKKGFKEIFNDTVFGYLAEYRLQEAKLALAENQKTATEIAFELGYSSLQHFSAAFKKKFGVSPKGR